MKNGIVHTLLYYFVCLVIFIGLTVGLESPRHAPGLNYFFVLLVILISIGLSLIHFLNYLRDKKMPYSKGALLIHLVFFVMLLATYFLNS